MTAVTLHREEVKAAIRMKCGSLEKFADIHGLKSQTVRDLLRGASSTAKEAVASILGVDADHLTIITDDSTNVERDSGSAAAAHRLNSGAI